MSTIATEEFLNQTEKSRVRFFETIGKTLGQSGPIVNPKLQGGPAWPTRPWWICLNRTENESAPVTVICSDGLCDPFAKPEANVGFGIEIAGAAQEDFGEHWILSWLADMVANLSNLAVQDGRYLLRFQKFGIFLMGFKTNEKQFDHLLDAEGYVGALLGLPISGVNHEFSIPAGKAVLITAKLLTSQEYQYVAQQGLEGAKTLAKRFTEDGSGWISALNRPSVV